MNMNAELEMAWKIVEKTGANLFLTGKAGTGKTTFLRQLREESPKRMVVLAPTGIAAINAGGVTIHSFFQLPLSPYIPGTTFSSKDSRFQKINKLKINIIRTMDLLVIDEISMVRADLLDAVDSVMRRYRERSKPFGGVQLLMIGDLHQLTPVVKGDEWTMLSEIYDTPYFFSSKALNMSEYVTIELKDIFRQQDATFINLLNQIRENKATDETLRELNKRYIPDFTPPANSDYIRLTTHNLPAQKINERELGLLPSKEFVFTAEVEGTFPETSYPADQKLVLKQGAQVMFIKNDPERRFFNGMIGEVIYVNNKEIIVKGKNEDDEPFYLNRMEWSNSKYTLDNETKEIKETVEGVFRQFPLRLAWAITIHKSQGLTFEHAIIDVERSFAHGQTYVALSRCKTLEGMVLSAPLHHRSIINDRTLDSYLHDISSHVPTASSLSSLECNYIISLLDELFDFISIQSSFNLVLRTLDEHFYKKYPKLLDEYKNLGNTFNEMIDVSRKFRHQYIELLGNEHDTSNEHLQERIHKASEYFFDKLRPFPSLCEKTTIQTENKVLKKQFEERFNAFSEDLVLKIRLLNYEFHNNFSTSDYLNVKANILLGIEDNTNDKTNKQKQKKKAKEEKPKKIPTKQISYDMFRKGMTIEDIALERGLTTGTILNHLAYYVKTGNLQLEDIIPENYLDDIREFMYDNPDCESIGQMKAALDPDISYNEIRIAVEILRDEI
ncbi:MAG: helix-turn-helix domain-containing protein [Prevotella sp.]|nr:helix-turn-helix domain-containing protein [Prevotella sp.]